MSPIGRSDALCMSSGAPGSHTRTKIRKIEVDPRVTPVSGITGAHWWIVECEEVGRTAIPGRKLAHQAMEVCRGVGLKVLKVRPANCTDTGDLVAIEQSRAELKDAQLRLAVAAGALPGARLNGQKAIATAP